MKRGQIEDTSIHWTGGSVLRSWRVDGYFEGCQDEMEEEVK